MSFVLSILLSSAAAQAYPVARAPERPANPVSRAAYGPPSLERIIEIEELARATPWEFTASGVLKTPKVEARALACLQRDSHHFACSYEIRVAPYGDLPFGDWSERKKVYMLSGEGWLMLNGEAHCAQLSTEALPAYCFPAEPSPARRSLKNPRNSSAASISPMPE